MAPKVSLPPAAALLARVVRHAACFPATRFYDTLMNWAISIYLQEIHRTAVFVLLEKLVVGGGWHVGGTHRQFWAGQAEDPGVHLPPTVISLGDDLCETPG